MIPSRTWQDELAIIDRTMRAISSISDPEELVEVYWNGVDELIPVADYVAVSRRGETPPNYLITRSSRFTEHYNPWTHRHMLPRMSGGLLGELIFAGKPTIIDNLPERLAADDPAWFHLQGYQTLIALPQYDGGEAINMTVMLVAAGAAFDLEKLPMMHWHAGLFGRGTQNLVLRNQLSEALSRLDRELQVVGAIQRSLLPTELPSIEGFELAAHYQTSARAGGDYYDFFPLAGKKWGLFIADVSGHGTPAAVLMAITHAIAHAQPGTHTPSHALLRYLNDRLTRAYTNEGTFVTAFYAVLDPIAHTLSYSVAGHNPPRLARGGKVISLDANGALPLGIVEGVEYTQSTIAIAPGDFLLLYTDGITEAMAPHEGDKPRELFGVKRLDDLLTSGGCDESASVIKRICAAVEQFAATAPADDQTLIAVRCT